MRLALGYAAINAYGRGHLTDKKRRKRRVYIQVQNQGETVCSGKNPAQEHAPTSMLRQLARNARAESCRSSAALTCNTPNKLIGRD